MKMGSLLEVHTRRGADEMQTGPNLILAGAVIRAVEDSRVLCSALLFSSLLSLVVSLPTAHAHVLHRRPASPSLPFPSLLPSRLPRKKQKIELRRAGPLASVQSVPGTCLLRVKRSCLKHWPSGQCLHAHVPIQGVPVCI